jgi:O-antigen/teichoic acid export membrane protein
MKSYSPIPADDDMTASTQTTKPLRSLGELSLSTFLATVLQLVLRLIKHVVFARLLGPNGRGVYGILTTIPELVVSFGNLGFGLGSVYLVAKKKYELPKVLGNALLYIPIQGLLLTGVALMVLSFKGILMGGQGTVGQMGFFMIAAIPILLFHHIGLDLLMGIKDIHLMNILRLVFSVFPLFLLILLWLLTDNALLSAMYAWIGSVITVSLLAFLRLSRKAGGCLRISRPYLKETFSFGLRGNVSMFANAVVRRIDILFIAHYLGAEAVGFYAVSVSIAEILLALPDAIAVPFLPIRLGLDKTAAQSFSPLIIKYVLLSMGIVCGLTALLGKPVVMILYGTRFLPAFDPLRWLLPGILALSLYQFLKADIYSLDRPGFISLISLLTMACNLVLNYLMIPRYGIEGAAISSSLSYALSTLILLVFILHKTGQAVGDVLLVKKKDLIFLRDQLKASSLQSSPRS